jgi:hypothetical protein
MATQEPPRLLRLPAELRAGILEYAAMNEHCFHFKENISHSNGTLPARYLCSRSQLLLANRQLHDEYLNAVHHLVSLPSRPIEVVVRVQDFKFPELVKTLDLLPPTHLKTITSGQKLGIKLNFTTFVTINKKPLERWEQICKTRDLRARYDVDDNASREAFICAGTIDTRLKDDHGEGESGKLVAALKEWEGQREEQLRREKWENALFTKRQLNLRLSFGVHLQAGGG